MRKITITKEQWIIGVLITIILILSIVVFKTRGQLGEQLTIVQINDKLNDHIEELEKANNTYRLDEEELLVNILNLRDKIKGLERELDTERQLTEALHVKLDDSVLFDEYSEDILTSYDVTKEYVQNDLRQHPELISIEAVLGGTMMFGNIRAINDQFVYADFEDGHIYGYGLYQYAIKDKTIEWKEIIVSMPHPAKDNSNEYGANIEPYENNIYTFDLQGHSQNIFHFPGYVDHLHFSYDFKHMVANILDFSAGESKSGYPVLFDIENNTSVELLKSEFQNFAGIPITWLQSSEAFYYETESIYSLDSQTWEQLEIKPKRKMYSIPSKSGALIATFTTKEVEQDKATLNILITDRKSKEQKLIETDLLAYFWNNIQIHWVRNALWLDDEWLVIETGNYKSGESIISKVNAITGQVQVIGEGFFDFHVSPNNNYIMALDARKAKKNGWGKNHYVMMTMEGKEMAEFDMESYQLFLGWSQDEKQAYFSQTSVNSIKINEYQLKDLSKKRYRINYPDTIKGNIEIVGFDEARKKIYVIETLE